MTRSCLSVLLLMLHSFTSQAFAGDPAATPPIAIKNPGFELGTKDWTVAVYGAKPTIESDATIVHEGKQSLKISTTDQSDTALGQDIQLRPRQLYRFTGWIRTRGLDPHGAPVCGTYQIQGFEGKGIVASGTNHQGDMEWTEVTIYFDAPSDGRVRVAVFFVGFGKGTGTAWFDDLKIEAVDPSKAVLKVTKEPLFAASLDRIQYGQFIEYLCDLVPSMWAEKLCDGSFEGLTPYKVEYLREMDNREHPWYPCAATNRAEYSLDKKNPVSGLVCKRIAVTGEAPCTVGIAQNGIAVDPDQSCTFSCFMRQEGVTGPVTVRLSRGGKEFARRELKPTGEWSKLVAPLKFSGRDSSATLSITFGGPGTLWLDNASLMPEKTVGGWRPDVVDAVRALKPGIIRFGGSALDDSNLGEFDWRDAIGDPDRRRPFRAWGGLQPAGAGLEEIVQFCERVGAEPLMCVRVSKKKPKDAADQVEYFNGKSDTPMGRLRSRNGHAEPYAIKYWQVGNELGGPEYENCLPEFCKAMKAVDPSIKLLSSYPTAGVLKAAGEWLDYVCPHHYNVADLAGAENDLNNLRALIRTQTKRPIRVAITEWNTTAGDFGPRRAMLWTLDNALACARYQNLLHRHGDLVAIANRSNLSNSFCSGIIQTDNHRLYKTPTYYAQQLYSTLAGDRPLRLDSALPASIAPDVSATLSEKGDAVTLFAVNSSLKDVTRSIDLSAFGGAGRVAEVWSLRDTDQSGEPDVANSFARPDRVVPVTSKLNAAAARFDYRFPALSLTVIRWKVK